MKRWPRAMVVLASFAVLTACGGTSDADLQQEALGQHEAGLDICGNGRCLRSELLTCPEDCNYGGYCGDGICQSHAESNASCPADCWAGCFVPEAPEDEAPQPRFDVCGNGLCLRSELQTCPEDCNYGGFCGDGICQSHAESSSSCPNDCSRPGCFAPDAP